MRISLYTSFEKKLITLAEKEGIAPSAYIKNYIVEQYNKQITNDPQDEVEGDNNGTLERGTTR